MTRNLKALGLALVAILALSAMGASAAQATHPAAITAAEYPAFGDSEEIEKLVVTKSGVSTTCETYEGSASIAEPSTTATVAGTLSNCYAVISGSKLPVTVTTNGCALVFHVTENTEPTAYTATADLECPAGKVVETHIYMSHSNHTSNISLCKQTIPPQSGFKGITLTNVSGEPDYVVAHINVGGITSVRDGSILCGAAHGPATLTGSLKLSATNEAGKPIDAEVGPDEL